MNWGRCRTVRPIRFPVANPSGTLAYICRPPLVAIRPQIDRIRLQYDEPTSTDDRSDLPVGRDCTDTVTRPRDSYLVVVDGLLSTTTSHRRSSRTLPIAQTTTNSLAVHLTQSHVWSVQTMLPKVDVMLVHPSFGQRSRIRMAT